MHLDDWAKQHLITPLPRDFPLWHWTRSPESVRSLRALVAGGRDLTGCGSGAVGRGLYLSASALDLMDRGTEVLFVTLREGTPVVMIDPELFGVGFSELFEIALGRVGWAWSPAPFRGHVDPAAARPAPDAIDGLLRTLGVPCCAYVLGMHLAFMVQDAGCLQLGPPGEQERSVAEYVKRNPGERPMLVPAEAVTRWLTARGLRG